MENELKIHHQPTILASSKIPSRILAPCVQSPLPVNYAAMDTLDIALRLGTATLVGAVLGLNRDLHGKPTGVRTLGLVCLGSALAVLSIHEVGSTDASRIIQGIMTGVGFLGAGVIVRNSKGHLVHGLTTAACSSLPSVAIPHLLAKVCADDRRHKGESSIHSRDRPAISPRSKRARLSGSAKRS